MRTYDFAPVTSHDWMMLTGFVLVSTGRSSKKKNYLPVNVCICNGCLVTQSTVKNITLHIMEINVNGDYHMKWGIG